MKTFGLESVTPHLTQHGYFLKCVVNSSAAIFFSGSIQHRDVKNEGVSYEDDYQGNALAATITPGKIEIRFHKDFPDATVASILRELLALPEMNWACRFLVEYQGRRLF